MMEAVRTSETSVDNHFTRQYIPEDNSEHQSMSVCLVIFLWVWASCMMVIFVQQWDWRPHCWNCCATVKREIIVGTCCCATVASDNSALRFNSDLMLAQEWPKMSQWPPVTSVQERSGHKVPFSIQRHIIIVKFQATQQLVPLACGLQVNCNNMCYVYNYDTICRYLWFTECHIYSHYYFISFQTIICPRTLGVAFAIVLKMIL
jgi:hypothetical protein